MIEAMVTLRGTAAGSIGRDRIRLLEQVARAGSITAGARAAGLSYKAAWDALDAMARLFGRPLLDTRAGGRAGGGARLTAAGAHVIATFDRLEADLSRAARLLDPDAFATPAPPRTSARNALRGRIEAIRSRRLTADVVLALPGGGALVAQVTEASLRGLDLAVGRPATALIKAPFVRLAPDDGSRRPAAYTVFAATVLSATLAGGAAEALLDIGAGRSLAATLTARRARLLGLAAGRPVRALIDPSDVILAVD